MTNRIGFRGFTKPSKIDASHVKEKLEGMDHETLFVLWTGNPYRMRKASGRSNSLRTIIEVNQPVPLKTLIERAAKAKGDQGYSPETVRSGLFLHRNSKPSVYIALEKRHDGAFIAAADYPNPDPAFFKKPLKSGDVIIEAPKASTKQITKK